MTAGVILQQGALTMAIRPDLGACCAELRYQHRGKPAVDLLRPLAPGDTDPFQAGSFVLVPYSNRLFGQRLLAWASETLSGRSPGRPKNDCTPSGGLAEPGKGAMVIPLNRENINHPVHGVGWRKHWDIVSSASDQLALAYSHEADAHWPFDHGCTYTITLGDTVVRFELTLTNLSTDTMPAGLGFHPCLALEADALLGFAAHRVWHADSAGLPMTRQSVSQGLQFDFASPQHADAVELNHCFSEWSGSAELQRPRHNLSVQLSADSGLAHLVVYRPAGQSWICVEPVSHATGSFSLQELQHPDHGTRWLAPRASTRAAMEIRVVDNALPGAH